MMLLRLWTVVFFMTLLSGCTDTQEDVEKNAMGSEFMKNQTNPIVPSAGISDPQATVQAAALFGNLKRFIGQGVLLGHQETLAYGVGWQEQGFDSDIFRVCGDFPAVFGWDLGCIGQPENIDHVPFEKMKSWIRSVYEKNGVNTISWHMQNPATGQNSWDTTPAVSRLLPGGDLHQRYCEKLDKAAEFLDIKGPQGKPIPMVLRFFHEQNGGWFWWSKRSCTPDEFIRLWRFTVDYFRNEKHMHQFLYAYSPDAFRTAEEYLETYPGDAYVDILAMDNYSFFKTADTHDRAVRTLEIIADLAAEKGKIAALTETGVEGMPDPAWFTGVLLKALTASKRTRQVVWAVLWRNENTHHFFSTYPGHAGAENFKAFYADPFTVFLSDLPDLYQ